MNIEKKIQIIVLMKCQHTFSKRLLTRAKTKTNFRKKGHLTFFNVFVQDFNFM